MSDAINFMDFFFCSELQKVVEMHVGLQRPYQEEVAKSFQNLS